MKIRLYSFLLWIVLLNLRLHAAVFTVSNTNSSGLGSLQQAIFDANTNAGPDIIAFSIATGGLTISPATPLPVVMDPVTIDGSTQPGYSNAPLIEISGASAGNPANGLIIGTSNCVVRALAINRFRGDNYYSGDAIQITNGAGTSIESCYLGIARDGVTPLGNAGAGVRIGNPLYYSGPITSNNIVGGSTAAARNLISGNGSGVYVTDSPGNQISGNFIGTDVAGSLSVGNTNSGVTVNSYYSTDNLVGGTNAGQRNLISGNGSSYYGTGDGVLLNGCLSNAVFGNYIGVDVTGAFALQNNEHGVNILFGNANLVGGAGAGQGNLISGNRVHGVNIGGFIEDLASYAGTPSPDPNGNIVQGNLIGTDFSGLAPLPNQSDGVSILNMGGNLIGGFLPGEGNIISFNTNNGVEINGYGTANNNEVAGNVISANQNIGVAVAYGVTGVAILSNSIYANTNLGIDLGNDGITFNDPGDTDTGANGYQNFPVLGFPIRYPTYTVISGTLNSAASGIYRIELFDNDNPDPLGYGEGQRIIAVLSITNDAYGDGSFVFTNDTALPFSDWITATATDINGNTSEFSLARQVVSPDSVDIEATLAGASNPAPKSLPFTYTITVTNNGPAGATGVVATDTLPPGLSFISAVSSQGSCVLSAGVLTCNIGALPAGSGALITLNVNATGTALITNTVSAFGNESDNNTSNNTASVATSFGIADVAVFSSDFPDPVVAGQTVTYTVTATNLGPDDASAAVLNFFADYSLYVTGATVSQGTVTPPGNGLSWSLGTLPVNGFATLTVTAIPMFAGTANTTPSINANEYDPLPGNNYTNETTTVQPGPGVIQFASSFYTVNESSPVAVIGVMRTGGAIGTVTVDFATSNLTAIAGVDYVGTNGTLTFLNGESNKTIVVSILDDGLTDCNETLLLRLFNPTGGAVLVGQTNTILQIFDSHSVPGGVVQGVSLANTNLVTTGNGGSQSPSISDDGRYIAFSSYANNLAAGTDYNGTYDVFIYDRVTAAASLVSLNVSNTAAASGFSGSPQISADGSHIGFVSYASDLTTNPASGFTQIYARNVASGSNQLVSVNTNGATGNFYSDIFSISADGSKFAFRSYSADLVANDTNNNYDVFYRDLASNSCVLVSVNAAGTGPANGYSDFAKISADGRYVAFGSYASDLSPADNNTRLDVYRRDMVAGTNELVSANASGLAGNSGCNSDIFISGDGRYVAFESSSTDLAPGTPSFITQVFRRDMQTHTTVVVSVNNAGAAGADGYSTLRGMSRDGRYILFSSYSDNIATNDSNFAEDLFLRDVLAGTTTLISANQYGTNTANAGSSGPAALSPDGRYVTFVSGSTDLTADPKQLNVYDAFQRDMLSGITTLLSTKHNGSGGGNNGAYEVAVSTNGVSAFSDSASDIAEVDGNNASDIFVRPPGAPVSELVSRGAGLTGNDYSFDHRVTADGSKVAFVSYAGNLVANDTNNTSDVFLYDLATHTMTLISANTSNNGSGQGASDSPRPSANGRFVAYHCVPFNAFDQICLRDAVSNVTTLVSVNRFGSAPGNGGSVNPQITPDGQYVVFESAATDLVSNDVNGTASDIFIRNRTNAQCELISLNAAGLASGNSDSRAPSISADGRFVAFETFASNLGPADSNQHFDVYVRDRVLGSNILCSPRLAGGNGGNADSFGALVSADGSKVFFFSYATDLVAGATNGNGHLYAFDITSRSLQLVSANTNGVTGNGSAFQAAVTANGRYVAFYSDSSDLVPNDTNQSGDVFVRDLVAGTTRLVSVACDGSRSANAYSDVPQISADGRFVTFHSYATDLVPGDFSIDSGSVFRRDLQSGTTVLVSQSLSLRGEANGQSITPYINDDGSVISFLSSANDLILGDANVADDVFAWSSAVSGIDLAITMTPSAASVPQGGALSYTLTVTNYGVVSATSITVTDALPASLSFVSASSSLGTVTNSGNLVTASIGTLNIGSGFQITINTTATAAGTVTNTALAGAIQTDFNPANNAASAVVVVTSTSRPPISFATTNGNQLFLSWPYASSGYNLETATNLSPALWLAVTNSISNNGVINYVVLPINAAETERFFRLHHP